MTEGWKTKKLGDVCELLNRGISPKYLEKGGICVLNQKCIRNHQINYAPSRRHDLSEKKVIEGRFIKLGDVLVNSTGTGTLGRVAQVREEPVEPTTVDSHVTIVRPKTAMFHLDFFGYMLIAIEDAIKEAGEGCGGQTELARSVLAEKFFVSFPEQFPEQQRIVEILDEAFESIITAKANIENNLNSTREIFASHLNVIFSQRGEGWVEKRLEQIGTTQTGSTPNTSKRENYGNFIPFIKPGDFNVDGSLNYTNDGLSEQGLLDARRVEAGSILMVCIGATIGKCGYSDSDITTNQQINAFAPFSGISHKFVYYQMLTKNFQQRVLLSSGQATLPIINKSKWSALTIALPPTLQEQKNIVTKCEALSAETQRLESIYQRKLAALNELKKSLLHQAFCGNLKGSP